MADTLTAMQQHAAYVARAEFNAAKTLSQTATITTQTYGQSFYTIDFDLPFLTTRPLVSTGWVLKGGLPPFPLNPQPSLAPFMGIVVSAGVQAFLGSTDAQGRSVFIGARVIVFVQTLNGQMDSTGDPAEMDCIIDHDFTFTGLAYRPVPRQVAS